MVHLKKWIIAGIIAGCALASQSCKKCEGEGPKFTAEEKSFLTDLQASDSLVFRSNLGGKRILYVFRRDFYEPKDGDKFDPPVKGSVTCASDDKATATIHLSTLKSTSLSDEVFVVGMVKDIISTNTYFSGSMLQNSSVSQSAGTGLDSLEVNGTVYRKVIMLQPGSPISTPGSGPVAEKMYYVKDKGLIRFDISSNEIWERVN